MKIHKVTILSALFFSSILHCAAEETTTFDTESILAHIQTLKEKGLTHGAIIDEVTPTLKVEAADAQQLFQEIDPKSILFQSLARAYVIMMHEGDICLSYLCEHASNIGEQLKKQPFHNKEKQDCSKKTVRPYAEPWLNEKSFDAWSMNHSLKKVQAIENNPLDTWTKKNLSLCFYFTLPEQYRSEIARQYYLQYGIVLEHGRGGVTPSEIVENGKVDTFWADLGLLDHKDYYPHLDASNCFLGTLEGIELLKFKFRSAPSGNPLPFNRFRKLNFTGNELRSFDHTHIASCSKRLWTLVLKKNWIEKIEGSLAVFTALQNLNLSHNKLGKALSSNTFQGLKKLQTLDLEDNGIKELPNGMCDCLPELNYLNLKHNKLSALDLTSQGLKKLKFLEADGNPIKELKIADGQSPELYFIHVSKTNLTPEQVAEFKSHLSKEDAIVFTK